MSIQIRTLDTGAGTAHSNSTTESSVASHTFTADSLQPGKVFLARCAVRATATNSTDTLTPAVRFGSSTTVTSNTSAGSGNAVDVADNDTFLVDLWIHCQSATRVVITGLITTADALGTDAVLDRVYLIATIAKGTTYYLDITADWSVASTANSCQSEAWAVLEVT